MRLDKWWTLIVVVAAGSRRRSPAPPASGRAEGLAEAVSSGTIEDVVRRVPRETRGPVAVAARAAFVAGLDRLFWISAGVALLGAVLAAVLVRGRDFEEQEPEQEPEPGTG